MAIINVDTAKIKECGNDMMNLSIELKEQIDGLFDLLSNVENNCWRGTSAEEFAKLSKLEKVQYIKLNNELYKEGKFLLDSSTLLEAKINKCKRT